MSHAQLVVYIEVSEARDYRTDVAELAVSVLAERTGKGRRTVQRALDALIEGGWLTVLAAGSGHRATRYIVHLEPVARGVTSGTPLPARGVTPDAPGASPVTPTTEGPEDPFGDGARAPAPEASPPTRQEAPVTARARTRTAEPDPDQLGMDVGVTPLAPARKRRENAAERPAGRVMAAWAAEYAAHHHRQPTGRARVAGHVARLLGAGHTEEELTEAALAMAHTDYTNLEVELAKVRRARPPVAGSPAAAPEGWGRAEPRRRAAGEGYRADDPWTHDIEGWD